MVVALLHFSGAWRQREELISPKADLIEGSGQDLVQYLQGLSFQSGRFFSQFLVERSGRGERGIETLGRRSEIGRWC